VDGLRGVNIYLVGMMGSGKTTVGRILAKKLKYRFFDTDELIVRVANQSIAEIFAQEGEEAFRELETKVLGELSASKFGCGYGRRHCGPIDELGLLALRCSGLAGCACRSTVRSTSFGHRSTPTAGGRDQI